MRISSLYACILTVSIISSIYPAYGATVFYANGAFTQNGIEWCEENKAIYDILGTKFFEHHNHSIESRVCANLIEDELWNYSGPDRVEKLIERSLYFSELEIAESQVEADIGVVDTDPVEVPDRTQEKPEPVLIREEENPKLKELQDDIQEENLEGGGCLIATAAYGSELSTQVQMLREIRDSKVINTQIGAMFVSGFNQFYYSFSPTIADMERQSPLFKELVKITITPLLSSLSLLNYTDMNSEFDVLVAGIGIISLNAGLYFIIPTVAVIKIRQKLLA